MEMNSMEQTDTFAGEYLNRLTGVFGSIDTATITRAVDLVESAWQGGHQVFTLGNGGSALTAQHYITDWNKSVFLATGKSFLGRSLCDNIGLLMAYSNDISYADVFAEQLKSQMQPGDLVIAISGSGNSENVLRAVDYANAQGGVTLGLCGYDGGKLRQMAQHVVWAPVNDMQLSEDIHFLFGHIVMQKLCKMKR
jgi:D-sedoheptulose 7-phosphate isomerase